ncbi:unnamed protein product [Haemonchus placei]|uniref:GTF3C1 extended winged-helix domain-containing protein n=1 Tax=Haemonchus placei TaxID=6290 RepID=A0A158QMJ3_HAEPC|nr:unnamed protein product [Haemonchus placei]
MASRKSVDKICANLATKTTKPKKQKTSRKRPAVDEEELIEEDSHEKPDSDEDFEEPQSSGETTSDIELSDNDIEIEELHSVQPGTSKAVAAAFEVAANLPKPKKVNKKSRGFSPLLDLLDVAPVTTTNFCTSGGTPYLSYNEESWNPMFLYRLPSDIVLSTIREHGTEGLGRAEIGKKIGMDTSAKAGNRRVSSYILTACNEHPDHVGQFQKMEGKVRCIKYFWKAESEPEQFRKLFNDFEKLCGGPCPFKLGQVVKFPDSNLSTLRISDVTLRRLTDLLDIVSTRKVVVTIHKVLKLIHEREQAYGYDFLIDKKSLIKCLKALENVHLIRVFETSVVAESIENRIQIVCHRDIRSTDDPEVTQAIQTTVDEYHQEGRVFPHGQLRRPDLEFTSEYGYQTKAIRCFVIHELAYQLVYGYPEGTNPTCYDLFPPGDNYNTWPVRLEDDLKVFVDEESPLRFLPPLPKFCGTERYEGNFAYHMRITTKGWFMVQDFLFALPLSAFVLVVHVNKKIDSFTDTWAAKGASTLRAGVLFLELKISLTHTSASAITDKKIVRQLEHIMLTLCALGLMAIAPNPDIKRFVSPRASVFYVSRSGVLYDTSTSGRGYASVTLPLSTYDKYNYEFNSVDDVVLYWHHLRAIVQSTPLAFRNDVNSEEISQARHKKYSMGQFDKCLVIKDPQQKVNNLTPLGPNEGVAGFDSALYIHLKRHWDVDPGQNSCVGWFIARFRKQSDKVRSIVEDRVANLKKDWNSYVKSLMPSELDLLKSKKQKNVRPEATQTKDGFFPTARNPVAIDPTAKKRPNLKKPSTSTLKVYPQSGKKKRPMDSVDLLSAQNRLHLRSRFNSRERDMLIMIRAVGFFLNPVYRFWLDPAVVRDIMHENIPESRSKTVQSLMAAGVREMVRPARLAYLQRIVRNLSTFQEMRDLRFLLASSPLSTPDAKATFFRNAFDVANRLLFMESQILPVPATPNKQFEEFLKSSRLTISPEQAVAAPLPLRSQPPASLEHIHHCVAINILLSILIHSTDGAFSESILDQISAAVISNALQVLRADGLVSRSRTLDPQLMVITKNQAILSYYFRHFFAHRFHPDIVEQSLAVFNTIDDSINETEELEGDLAGALVVASSSFYNDSSLDVCVDDEVFTMFESAALEQSTQSIKQIRYLESADLHLEKIHVYQTSASEHPELPTWQSLTNSIDWSQPASRHPPPPFEEFLLDIPVSQRKNLRSVYKPIKEAGAKGIKFSDIQIVPVGVEVKRWVAAEFASAWCVNVGGRLVSPRPWTMPSVCERLGGLLKGLCLGEICASTVRWMAESVLMTAVSSPGITMKDICFRLEFALQGAAVQDLITVLESAGCVKVIDEVFENMNLVSPFQEGQKDICVSYVLPAVDSIERFSKIFGDVPLLPAMVGRTETEKEEARTTDNTDAGPEMKVTRMSFLSGFFIGGVSTYLQAKETYERSNVGRKYLSPSDAIKRRVDYAIARFAKSGFSMGFKCALISGGIILNDSFDCVPTTIFIVVLPSPFRCASGRHASRVTVTNRVGVSVFIRLSSINRYCKSSFRLTLSAVAHLYALSIDKSVNEAYWTFKKEYDKELRKEQEWEERVRNLMKEERIWWKATAVHKLKKLDEESLAAQDA